MMPNGSIVVSRLSATSKVEEASTHREWLHFVMVTPLSVLAAMRRFRYTVVVGDGSGGGGTGGGTTVVSGTFAAPMASIKLAKVVLVASLLVDSMLDSMVKSAVKSTVKSTVESIPSSLVTGVEEAEEEEAVEEEVTIFSFSSITTCLRIVGGPKSMDVMYPNTRLSKWNTR